MYPAPFEYVCPSSLTEAARLLNDRQEEAKILAGGQSLIPLLKLRLAAPQLLVDIGQLRELKEIRETADAIEIGSLVRHAEIERSELLARTCPLLIETASQVGDVQVRNRGTLGGSLAHADPAGDFPAAVLALDARLIATSARGQRTIPVRDFFVELMTTALQPNEILTAICVPTFGRRTGSAYAKMRQQASGFAIAGVAAVLRLDAKGIIAEARVAITGVGPMPYRAEAVEKGLAGRSASATVIRQAAAAATDGVEVSSDLHASQEYRRELAAIFARRALEKAATRADQNSR
jgi:aerobic carbon-monoxide dehydrogenase medium subunit